MKRQKENARGQQIAKDVAELHGDTLEQSRRGNNLLQSTARTEKNEVVEMHDMLTGSQLDGRAYTDNADHTCNNWTSHGMGVAQVGHSNRNGGGNYTGALSWVSAHPTLGCSQQDLARSNGAGLFYCFAVN